MFLFKKIVAQFFFPVPFCLGMLLLGLFFLWFTRRQKTGKIVVSLGVLLLAALSFGTVSNVLLEPLEYKYTSLLSFNDVSDVRWIVVLAGGHTSDPQISSTSQLSPASLIRLAEGIRLYNSLPECKLILSGGKVFDPISNAKALADVAMALGVYERDIVLEQDSKDTKDEAIFTKDIVGNGKFILVTSASHMPRSMALFRKQGMEPIPAPTDYFVKESQGEGFLIPFPSSYGLVKARMAFYEYLGMTWAKVRGQI